MIAMTPSLLSELGPEKELWLKDVQVRKLEAEGSGIIYSGETAMAEEARI